jgi:hypothetical protein
MKKRQTISKRVSLGKALDAQYAREAECTPAMIRHVLRWGLGQNPSPERHRAYYTLRFHGKLP